MMYIPQELGLINLILQVDNENKPRQFTLSELSIALSIFNKLKKNTKDEQFIEGKVDLTPEEKLFVKKYLEERSFTVLDAEFVFGLQEKLSK